MLSMCVKTASARSRASSADVRTYYGKMEVLSPERLLQIGKELTMTEDKPDSALVCFTIVKNKTRKLNNQDQVTQSLQALHGMWYIYMFHYADYTKAKDCLVQYHDICEKTYRNLGRSYLMYGAMFETMANNADEDTLDIEAVEYYRKAIAEARKDKEEDVIINSFTNLVELCDDAEKILTLDKEYKALMSVKKKNATSYPFLFAELSYHSSVELAKGNYAEAKRRCEDLIAKTPDDVQHTRYMLFAKMKLSRIFAKSRQWTSAIAELKKVEGLCTKYDIRDGKILVYDALCEYYDSIGDRALQREYHIRHLALKDSMTNYQQMVSIKEMSFLSEMHDVEMQMEQMERSRRYWVAAAIVLSVIAIVVAVFLAVLKRKNARLRQSNEALYERNLEMLRRDELQRKDDAEKYKQSSLDDETKESVLISLRNVMETNDEVFSPEFSIDRLAELASTKSKVASQVINEMSGGNFNAFVNEYRIKEACKRMNDLDFSANLTIEAIGNGVGFKSRNTFNIAFKRFTGLTPREYQSIAKAKLSEKK